MGFRLFGEPVVDINGTRIRRGRKVLSREFEYALDCEGPWQVGRVVGFGRTKRKSCGTYRKVTVVAGGERTTVLFPCRYDPHDHQVVVAARRLDETTDCRGAVVRPGDLVV